MRLLPDSMRVRIALALGVLAYLALLAGIAMQPPAYDPTTMRGRIAEIRARPAAPVDPLPRPVAEVRAALAMARDPLR